MYSVMWYFVVAVAVLQDSYVEAGLSQWSGGEYALLKPETDCPSKWKDKAWVFQDTKLTKTRSNERSRILHIDGHVSRYYVVRSFCIQTEKDGSLNWPQGQYCIYRNKQNSTGAIQMIGEHDNNKDSVKYTGSFVQNDYDGTKRQGIKFYFACRTSGDKKIPISLPITKPFYLLPYGSRDCQQVKWMVATSEWIKYQTNPKVHKEVPYNKLEGNIGIKMFYCYYQSCNSTLNGTSGVFHSPGFPDQYPDGQLCSWRIMVPENHILHVRFTHFSLSANDSLKYSKSSNGSFKPWYTIPLIYSMVQPFTVSSNSTVLFVFRSDESNNSTGFRAEYRVTPQLKPITTPTATHTELSATLPSETSSIPLTTPSRELIEETTKKTSTTSKKEDVQTTTQTTNSKSTVSIKTKGGVRTNQQQLTTIHESSTPSNCTNGDRVKEPLTNSRQWDGKLIVILIPLTCFLVVVFVTVDIVYRYRSVGQLPLVVNPTYDSGAIILNQPNDTTIPTTLMRVENGPNMTNHQPLTDRPPDYEDVENWKPSKTAPNMEYTIPGCNGSNSETTTEKTNKISENPFYESAMTSPPFAEANELYESVKMDQGKAKN